MFILHDYGFTPNETGELLGFDDGTVRNRLKEYCCTYGNAPDPVALYGVLFSYWNGKSLVDSANDNGVERGVARRWLRMGDFDEEIGRKRRGWRKITPELRAQIMELKSQKLSDRKIAKMVDRYYRVVGRIVKEETQAREDKSALIVPELLRV